MLRIPLLADHEHSRLLCRRHHNGPRRALDLASQTEPGWGNELKTDRVLTRLHNQNPTRRGNPAGDRPLSPNKRANQLMDHAGTLGWGECTWDTKQRAKSNAGTSEAEKEAPDG